MTFKFPKKLPKEWIEAFEKGQGIQLLKNNKWKIVGKDERGTIVNTGKDSFKVLHDGKNSENFGYETKGSSSYSTMYDYIFGSEFSCPEAGTATSMTAYMKCPSSEYGFQMAIYKSSDQSLVGETEEYRSTGAVDTWVTVDIESGGSLEATDYYLVIWQDDTGMYFYYDAGANGAYDDEVYGGVNPSFPNPWDQSDWGDKKFSIYCTYTPSDGGLSIPVAMHHYGHHIGKIIRG